MITDLNRAYYLGGSDAKYINGNYDTKTFKKWWDVKLGLDDSSFSNIYTVAGNLYEGAILDYLEIPDRNMQAYIGRIRINYDARLNDTNIEVKTHNFANYEARGVSWKPLKEYEWQVQFEMWGANLEDTLLIDYALKEEDYIAAENGTPLPIDESRLHFFPRSYDEEFMDKFLIRVNYLSECLKNETYPSNEGLKDYESRIHK